MMVSVLVHHPYNRENKIPDPTYPNRQGVGDQQKKGLLELHNQSPTLKVIASYSYHRG